MIGRVQHVADLQNRLKGFCILLLNVSDDRAYKATEIFRQSGIVRWIVGGDLAQQFAVNYLFLAIVLAFEFRRLAGASHNQHIKKTTEDAADFNCPADDA